jgi:hypothetical protein
VQGSSKPRFISEILGEIACINSLEHNYALCNAYSELGSYKDDLLRTSRLVFVIREVQITSRDQFRGKDFSSLRTVFFLIH